MVKRKNQTDGYCEVCGQYFKHILKHLSQRQSSCNAILTDKSIVNNRFISNTSSKSSLTSSIPEQFQPLILQQPQLNHHNYSSIGAIEFSNEGIINYSSSDTLKKNITQSRNHKTVINSSNESNTIIDIVDVDVEPHLHDPLEDIILDTSLLPHQSFNDSITSQLSSVHPAFDTADSNNTFNTITPFNGFVTNESNNQHQESLTFNRTNNVSNQHDIILTPNESQTTISNENDEFNVLNYKYDLRQQSDIIDDNRYNYFCGFTPQTLSCLQLLKLLQNANIPNNHYGKFIDWFNESNLSMGNSVTIDSSKNYKKVVEYLDGLLTSSNKAFSLKPEYTIMTLPSGRFIRACRFKFESVLHSLLSIPDMLDENNSLLYDKYYRDPSKLDDLDEGTRCYGDFHTGSWFSNAHKNVCKSKHDVLLPIIIFIDGTNIDSYGKLNLEAVMMTLGIFNRDQRNKASAWRMLGYLIDPTSEGIGNNEYKSNEKKEKRIDYHHNLAYILEGLYQMEKSDGFLWTIHSKSKNIKEDIRFQVRLMIVMGDAVGLDKLADMYITYNSKRSDYVCRDCNVPSTELNNAKWKCDFTSRNEIKAMDEKQSKKRCFYKVDNNCFDHHDFGRDEYHINGCSPPEILHQFLEGVMKKLIQYVTRSVSVKGLVILNDVTKYLATRWYRQSNKKHNNIHLFKDGLMKSSLTADETASQLVMIYLSIIQTYIVQTLPSLESMSTARSKIVKTSFNDVEYLNAIVQSRTTNNNERNNKKPKLIEETKVNYPKFATTKKELQKWITFLEYTIALHFWLRQKEIPYLDMNVSKYDTSGTESPLMKSVRSYMELYVDMVKEIDGCGTQVAKIHWMLHYQQNGRKYGSFLNYDGGIGERNLKPKVKIPARRTQKRQSSLAIQACERDYERTTVDTVHTILELKGIINSNKQNILNDDENVRDNNKNECIDYEFYEDDRKFIISGLYNIEFDNTFEKVLETGCKYGKKNIPYDKKLLSDVMKRLQMNDFQIESPTIHGFTGLKIESNNNEQLVFRSDPMFHGKPWLDWCMTSWCGNENIIVGDEGNSVENDDDTFVCPSQILMFINPSKMKFNVDDITTDKGHLWAVVRSTLDDKRKSRNITINLSLSTKYEIENKIRIINCDNIVRDAFVIADVDSIMESTMTNRKNLCQIYKTNHVICLEDINIISRRFIDKKW